MKKQTIYSALIMTALMSMSFAQLSVDSKTSANLKTEAVTTGGTSVQTNVDISSGGSVELVGDNSVKLFTNVSEEIKASDSKITMVSETETDVTVEFVEKVKLFGLFSVNMKSDVVVKNDASVNVDRPFWAFLAIGKSDSAKIESDISSKISASTKFDANAKINILNNIKASIDANVSATVN